jgi:hypothetical protein
MSLDQQALGLAGSVRVEDLDSTCEVIIVYNNFANGKWKRLMMSLSHSNKMDTALCVEDINFLSHFW